MLLRLAALALCAALIGWSAWSAHVDTQTPRTLTQTAYVGSGECKRCHSDHHESWQRTYHRTMTQEAHGDAVLGTWDGTTLQYMGITARMHRDRDGTPLMSFARDGGAERWQARVDRTVGSHRYQQYLARDGDQWFRLPIAWDVSAQRFIHMNGAFLTPDPEVPAPGQAITRADYDRHVTRWNDNCVFCHNVHPNPGLDPAREVFDTQVAELGIACEACHGPGAEHVARNHDPMRRYLLHTTGRADPTIRNPARMTAARSAQVCGRCHGQRITSHIERFYEHGDAWIPGDDLAQHSTPLARDTTQNGVPGVFAARFWNDGTPRLTAYEYQGYLQSACGKDERFTCESCHAMHEGDPRGQMRPDLTGDRMCTQCHADLASTEAHRRHARHDPSGDGARCVGCHMPKLVYGLVSMHVSHRIESPAPARNDADERPDACTLCHVDRDRAWAISEYERLFGTPGDAGEASPLSEVEMRLLAGDPIERAAAASALGEPSAAFATSPRTLALLLDTMLVDTYPAVRAIAARSARAYILRAPTLPEKLVLPDFVATDLPDERARIVDAWRPHAAESATQILGNDLLSRLRASATHTTIEIGE
jgi:predicted CXXCH cytochrome family protein